MDEAIAEKVEAFFKQYKQQIYKKGEILMRADDDPTGVFYLKKGVVRQYTISRKGEELVVNIYKPVSFFPMSWAINSTPNEYFYEAMTESIVFRTPKEKIIEFVKNNPDVLYDLIGRVYRGTDGMLKRMTFLMAGKAYSRIIFEIVTLAKRFGKTDKIGKTIIPITEKDIAAELGMARETVSREMKILKGRNLVMLEKNTMVVHNLQKLKEELSNGV